ncbi:uncharacterized protein LOC128649038 [Bombina bombina]|uniref:uncharacterized protein LOC128649038 n=1 Tax=Bombina bombina TaxID=8345 RepID=UPI00235B043B|nr:uncharacterized protein LOC128649038 [Bombina bombina]
MATKTTDLLEVAGTVSLCFTGCSNMERGSRFQLKDCKIPCYTYTYLERRQGLQDTTTTTYGTCHCNVIASPADFNQQRSHGGQ